jgi:hypothetical protein
MDVAQGRVNDENLSAVVNANGLRALHNFAKWFARGE